MILHSTGPVAEILEMPGKARDLLCWTDLFKNAKVNRIVIVPFFGILGNLQNFKVQILRFEVAKIQAG